MNKNTGKKALVVANFDSKNEITVSVDMPGAQGQLVYVSPENYNETAYKKRVTIKPSSVIVLIEK